MTKTYCKNQLIQSLRAWSDGIQMFLLLQKNSATERILCHIKAVPMNEVFDMDMSNARVVRTASLTS
jgi:hypothetical protein